MKDDVFDVMSTCSYYSIYENVNSKFPTSIIGIQDSNESAPSPDEVRNLLGLDATTVVNYLSLKEAIDLSSTLAMDIEIY